MSDSNIRIRPPSLTFSRSQPLSNQSSTTRPNSPLSGYRSANESPSNSKIDNSLADRETLFLPNSGNSPRVFPTFPSNLSPNSAHCPISNDDILTPPNSTSYYSPHTVLQSLTGPTKLPSLPFLHFLKGWSDEQVSKWLNDIRLPHLSPIFSKHDIVGKVLLDVDHEALKEMGIWKVGERVKIMVAIKSLRERCLADGKQPALHHALTSGHLNINNPNHLSASFPSSADSTWSADYASSSSKTTNKLQNPGSSMFASSSNFSLHPLLLQNRSSSRLEYQALAPIFSMDCYNQPRRDRGTTEPGTVLATSPSPLLNPGRAGISSFSDPHLNTNPQLNGQGAVWNPDFWGISKASGRGNLPRKPYSGKMNSDPDPLDSHPSSGTTAPLFIKKTEHRKLPGFNGATTDKAIVTPGSPGQSASSLEQISLIASGKRSSRGQVETVLSSIFEDTRSTYSLKISESSHPSRASALRTSDEAFEHSSTSADDASIGPNLHPGRLPFVAPPTLDEVIRKTIKVTLNENGIMKSKTINVENLESANEFMDRVMKKFSQTSGDFQTTSSGRVLNPGEWIIFLKPEEGVSSMEDESLVQPLDDHELLDICRCADRPERQRGLMIKQNFNLQWPMSLQASRRNSLSLMLESTSDLLALVQLPQKKRHRASVVSVMSGLMTDPFQKSEPSWNVIQISDAAHHDQPEFSTGKGTFCKFSRHRPSSKIISTHLVDYFPQVENKKNLSKSVKMSVRKSLAMRRSSAVSSTQNQHGATAEAVKASWDPPHYPLESLVNPNSMSPSTSLEIPARFLNSSFSIDTNKVQRSLGEISAPSSQHSAFRTRFHTSEQPGSTDWAGASRSSVRASFGAQGILGGKRESRRDSENYDIPTVDEVTAEVAHRKMSMGGEVEVVLEEEEEQDTASEGNRVRNPIRGNSGHGIPYGGVGDGGSGEEPDDGEDEEDEKSEEGVERYDDPQKMTSSGSKAPIKWVRGALIGAGSFGRVYLGMHALNGTLMAVKQVDRRSGTSQNEERQKSMLSALVREIEFLKELQHRNIVQYLDSSADEFYFNIFLEYVPGGSVSALLKEYGAFEEALVKSFTRQILDGLKYLHSKEIIHRDIKGANVLVDNKAVIKISDFGISKRVANDLLSTTRIHRPSLQGSVFWMAPEVVKQTSYTRKADIWSLGCLIVEMLTGEHPWANLSQMQAIFRIGSLARPEIPDDVTDECLDLLDKTFLINHLARPTADQLSQHAFFNTVEVPPAATDISKEISTESAIEPNTVINRLTDSVAGTFPFEHIHHPYRAPCIVFMRPLA